MESVSLKDLAIPIIKSIDSFNYLLKDHHRRTAVASYHIGKAFGLGSDEIFRLIVAAALHDIGALSVQERDSLIVLDVENPKPHCVMGHKMLAPFDIFKHVAQILNNHQLKLVGLNQRTESPATNRRASQPVAQHRNYHWDRVRNDVQDTPGSSL